MSVKKLVAMFIGALFVFLIFLTPVTFIFKLTGAPAGIAYQSLSGTIWSGSASVVQVDKWHLNAVKWTMNSSQLLLGKLSYDIKFGNARASDSLSGKGKVVLGISNLSLSEVTLRAPATAVQPYLPIPTAELSGRVILDLDMYQVSAENDQSKVQPFCHTLSGNLLWTKAEFQLGGPVSLGSISSELSCNESGAIVASFDGNNRLGLSGEGIIAPNGGFGFTGFLKPAPELPRSIHNGVSMFSRLDAQGRYPIKL